MKIDAQRLIDGTYVIPDGGTIKREQETLTPSGNRQGGRWAFRCANGTLVDYDQYINDLAERRNINLYTDSNVSTDVIKQSN